MQQVWKIKSWANQCRDRERRNYGSSSNRGKQRRGRSKSRETQSRRNTTRKVDEMQENQQDAPVEQQFDNLTFHEINVKVGAQTTNVKEVFTTLKFQRSSTTNANLVAKLDSGSEGNTLPIKTFRRIWPRKLTAEGFPKPGATVANLLPVKLTAYNGLEIPNYGAIDIEIQAPNTKKETSVTTRFYIVESEGPVILGYPSLKELNLVTFHCAITANQPVTSVGDLKQLYPHSFDGMGNFPGEYHICLKDNASPVIHAPRKCSIHIRDQLKQELDQMEADGVIRKITEPTDWVSSIAISQKQNGRLLKDLS
jgi:hypothetical protein